MRAPAAQCSRSEPPPVPTTPHLSLPPPTPPPSTPPPRPPSAASASRGTAESGACDRSRDPRRWLCRGSRGFAQGAQRSVDCRAGKPGPKSVTASEAEFRSDLLIDGLRLGGVDPIEVLAALQIVQSGLDLLGQVRLGLGGRERGSEGPAWARPSWGATARRERPRAAGDRSGPPGRGTPSSHAATVPTARCWRPCIPCPSGTWPCSMPA